MFGSLLCDLVVPLVALGVAVVAYFKWKFQFWRNKNVPQYEPLRIPFGNMQNPFSKDAVSPGEYFRNIYREMRAKGWKHGGMFLFALPSYMVLDLDILKHILTKDFQYFTDRGLYYNEKDDPVGAHLFAIGGTKWKNLRAKLTPTFTSGKMKMMFQTLVDCEENMREAVEEMTKEKTSDGIDIKNVLGCYTTDVIGSCAFGLECNSFKNPNSPFREFGKKIFTSTSNFDRVRFGFAISWPELARKLGIRQLPKEIADFYTKIVTQTVAHRDKNNIRRNDFLQLLIELKNSELAHYDGYKHDGKTLSMEEVVAQAFIFFFAGFETSSTTMTFALYELAKNQEIQEKVRQEIKEVLKRHDGIITYDAMQDMKYMEQVIDETLRKYPPVPVITRLCVKDYQMPDGEFVMEKGTRINVPIYGIHHDPEYYPEPEKFDPERFTEENKQKRNQYTYLPFGEGPRICIGLRFGVMQSKVGLTSLLSNFRFTVNKKTQEPIKMQKMSPILSAIGEIWLDAEKI